MSAIERVGVLGAGAWGTALAILAARAGRETVLWCRRPEHAAALAAERENAERLPGVELPPALAPTADLAAAAGAQMVLAAAPAQQMRAVLSQAASAVAADAPVVLCAKGLEQGSRAWMSEVLAQTIPHAAPAVLSGPSFATDAAHGLPVAVTLASPDPAVGRRLAEALGQPTFRPYLTRDVLGAEIGGAVKNVLAIAGGIVLGRKLGASAHAALITRGFAEMTRLGAALGADRETLRGLCGFGDLVLTCSHLQSRNLSLGFALGEGRPLGAILGARRAVTEGVSTAPALAALARARGVEMPICEAVDAVLDDRLSVDAAIDALLTRPLKDEAG